MLEDGKKATTKPVVRPIENGHVSVETMVGKLGMIKLAIDGDGYAGTLNGMDVLSEKTDSSIGVLTGSLSLKYLDSTGKIKTNCRSQRTRTGEEVREWVRR